MNEVSSFVKNLRGTNPEGGKEPQGDFEELVDETEEGIEGDGNEEIVTDTTIIASMR